MEWYCLDYAIWAGDLTLQPDRQTKDALRWRAAAAAAGGQVPASMVIPDSVDSALCSVLYEIDGQEPHATYRATGGARNTRKNVSTMMARIFHPHDV
jgi:hypothetical protein